MFLQKKNFLCLISVLLITASIECKKNYFRYIWEWGEKKGVIFLWQEKAFDTWVSTLRKLRESNLGKVQAKLAIGHIVAIEHGPELFSKLVHEKVPVSITFPRKKKSDVKLYTKQEILKNKDFYGMPYVFADDFPAIANETTGKMILVVK